ncbi:MAG: TIM barrel protein [Actinomycetota bacterium]
MTEVVRFSANVGFLWPELDLPDRIVAAGRAGFSAVECHLPYDHPPDRIVAAMVEGDVEMIGLNTDPGPNGPADFGLAARPGREGEARAAIDQAVAYADAIGCRHVNVVPGLTGGTPEAEVVFRANLAYACERAAIGGRTVVIEPLSPRAVPGAHLRSVEAGLATLTAVGADNLKLMFDCYHVQVAQGDVTARLRSAIEHLGHVQIAAVPDRGEPDTGELDYRYLLAELDRLGYSGWVGAEYHPRGGTDAGLGWRDRLATSRTEDVE